MTETTQQPAAQPRTVVYGGFTIERTLPAPPARVFAAFADPSAKAQWFGVSEEWELLEVSLDFRVGGEEVNHGRHISGMVSEMWAQYQDIVPDQRIVWSYRMALNGAPISASLASVELTPEGERTRMVFTEQDEFADNGGREQGTNQILDVLAAFLDRSA
ncbi:MAG: SRPBCC family protein [Chloroflexi bacterium]|nr:SRPBCC family protein [Chloroflexota bacterium]